MARPRDIDVVDLAGKGCTVAFPYDGDRTARFRRRFPKAHFNRTERHFFIPGVLATRRALLWRQEEVDQHGFDRWAIAKLVDALAFDPLPPRSWHRVLPDIAAIGVETPKLPAVIQALKRIGGAHWSPHLRLWLVPVQSRADLEAAIPAIDAAIAAEESRRHERGAGRVERARSALQRQVEEARLAAPERPSAGRETWDRSAGVFNGIDLSRFVPAATPVPSGDGRAIMRAARHDAEMERRLPALEGWLAARSRRDLVPVDHCPEIGATTSKGGREVACVRHGRPFTIRPAHVAEHGAELLPFVGRLGRYCYWKEIDHDR